MKLLLILLLCGTAQGADLRPYSMSPASGDSRYVNITGDNMSGQLTTASTLTVQGSAFSVGGSTLVVSGGKVGIGTTAPATKLHMSSGTLTIDGTGAALSVANFVTINDTLGYGFINLTGGSGGIIRGNGVLDLQVSGVGTIMFSPSNTGEQMRLTSAGRLGIGTPAPATKLSVSSSTASSFFFSVGGAMTKAEILAYDPVKAGEMFYCTDCTTSNVCISTGTAVSQVADMSAKTTACN